MRPREGAHHWSCAQRLRLSLLIAAGDPDEPSIHLLHQIAERIRTCCGHLPLKCHRLAHGWSVVRAIQRFHAMCDADPQLKRRGLAERSWRQWEAGDNCDRDYQDLLCRLFSTGPVQLGFAKDYGPTTLSPRHPEEHAHEDADVIAAAAHEACEQAERAEISEIGPGTLEQLRFAVTRLAHDYVNADPLPLFMEMRWTRDRIIRALERRTHPRQSTELHFLAGAVCGLMANASLDFGRYGATDQLAQAAWTHGHVVGHHPLMAWSRGLQALGALWAGHPSRADGLVMEGLGYLPSGPGAARLHAIRARALATAGNSSEAMEALDKTEAFRDASVRDDLHSDVSGEFSFGPAKHRYYEAVTRTALKDHDAAEAAATAAIALYRKGPPSERSYGCEALAHIQLATIQLATGRTDDAARALQQVFQLTPDRRINSISGYLKKIQAHLAEPRLTASMTAQKLLNHIGGFRADSVVRALPAPSTK